MVIKKTESLLDYYSFTKTEQRKYPVITKILKQLTPERIEKEVEKIKKIELPEELQRWIKEYEKIGTRSEFIWKWLYEMFPIVRFDLTFPKYQEKLLVIKILLTIFVVLLDDVADKKQKNSIFVLKELLKIPSKQEYINYNNLKSNKNKKYLLFALRLWDHIINQIKECPNYKDMEEIFLYDIDQVLNAMEYSRLVNKTPSLINTMEYWLYLPHNMTFMVYLTIDLMCCKKKEYKNNLGLLRGVMCEIQKMGRISNWLTTWQREIRDSDFTSGIFAYAVEKKIIDMTKINNMSFQEIIKKIKEVKIENYLLEEWEKSYNKINNLKEENKTMNLKYFLEGQEHLFLIDLICQGRKQNKL